MAEGAISASNLMGDHTSTGHPISPSKDSSTATAWRQQLIGVGQVRYAGFTANHCTFGAVAKTLSCTCRLCWRGNALQFAVQRRHISCRSHPIGETASWHWLEVCPLRAFGCARWHPGRRSVSPLCFRDRVIGTAVTIVRTEKDGVSNFRHLRLCLR